MKIYLANYLLKAKQTLRCLISFLPPSSDDDEDNKCRDPENRVGGDPDGPSCELSKTTYKRAYCEFENDIWSKGFSRCIG
jgi:hypothetical protein